MNAEQFDPMLPEITIESDKLRSPELIIDTDAPDDIRKQLQADVAWLQHRPIQRAAQIHDKPYAEVSTDSAYGRLVSKEYSRYYEFDASTSALIEVDHEMKRLHELRKTVRSSDEAENLAFQTRKRRLEIFMERIVRERTIGRHSLEATE